MTTKFKSLKEFLQETEQYQVYEINDYDVNDFLRQTEQWLLHKVSELNKEQKEIGKGANPAYFSHCKNFIGTLCKDIEGSLKVNPKEEGKSQ